MRTNHFMSMVRFMVLLLCTSFAVGSCSDSGGYEGPAPKTYCDASKPVVFTDFTPKEGLVRESMFIEGSNFGTDPAKIDVTIGGVKAPVIGASNTKIYLIVPRRCNEGNVVVTIKDEQDKVVKTFEFEEKFNLNSTLQVGTLTGKVDPQTNSSSLINGSLEDAEFLNPWWIELDKDADGHKVLYLIDKDGMEALRKIDLTTKTVSTIFTKGQAGVISVKSMTFDATRDTLLFVDDNGRGNWNDRFQMPNIHYALRSEGFRKVYPYLYGQCSYSAVAMNDGTVFYNTWSSSMVIKGRTSFNTDAKLPDGTQLFSVKSNSQDHAFMCKHPDELYVYMNGFHGIYRCAYDKVNKVLVSSVLHVGDLNGGSGYNDAPGSSARFSRPRQGVFVKNEQYVLEGKEDVYDYYVCDTGNNAIRKITPDGQVSTFAGRGSVGTDGKVWGWIDGEARETARFREPCGICYDPEEGVFYVADKENKRIRTISVE